MKRITLVFTVLFALNIWIAKSQITFFNYTDPNQILAIEEDGDYFWAGTNGGLYKWFKSGSGLIGKFHVNNGLPSNLVHTIKKDHFYNEIWVGTDNGLAMLNVLNQWTIFTTDDGLSDNIVKDIAIDLSGNKWLATANGVTMYNPVNSSWHTYSMIDGLIHNQVEAIDVDYQGNVWIGTWGGVSKYDPANNSWVNYDTADGLSSLRVLDIATDDSKGFVWCGTSKGISKFDGFNWEIYNTDSGLIDDAITSLAVDVQGNVWIGTNFGVIQFDGTSVIDTLTMADGLASDIINTINIDAYDNKWFGNFNGVTSLAQDGTTWNTYTTGEGVVDNRVRDIVVDSENEKWIGTNEGVSRFDDKHWLSYVNELINNNVTSIAIDNDGKYWFGTTGGVSVFNDTVWKEYSTIDSLIDDNVNAITVDSLGVIWIATLGGVSTTNGNTWEEFTIDSGLASNHVEDIAVDKDNVKWFATFSGISMYNDTVWTTFDEGDGLVNNEVYVIAVDNENKKWIGTYDGLSVFDGNAWTNYTTVDGLIDNWIQDISFDQFGNVWICTSAGVSKFNGFRWVNYSSEDGLAHDDVSSVSFDLDGIGWFGTIGGISKASCEIPHADFIVDTTCLPAQTIFQSISEKVDPSSGYQWDLNLNDTIDQVVKDISNQYSEPGIYQAKLIVNNLGCTDTIIKNVVVRITPELTLITDGSDVVCSGQSTTLTAVVDNPYVGADYKYLWSGIERTQSIEADSSKTYILNVVDGNCISESDSATIEVVYPYADEQICMVTVDPNTGKNLVTWEKTENMGIASYNVYKLIGNQYSLIGNVPVTNVSVYEDLSSDPSVKAERYSITVIDTCGSESGFSPYHQTIHLGVSQGLGPNEVVLDWTEYMDESGVFDPIWYYVSRGSSPGNMVVIDSLSSVIGTEWNDPNSMGDLYYRVTVNKDSPCDPANLLKASNGPFSRSLSNLEDNRQQSTDIEDNTTSFSIYPNPARDIVSVSSPYELQRIQILSTEGKVMLQQTASGNETELDISFLQGGLYIVKISNENGVEFGKLMVE